MKNLIILGGNSTKNIKWIDLFEETFSSDFNVIKICYEHWNNGDEMNFDFELENFENKVKGLEDYYIISKSIGSVLTLTALKNKSINPKKVVILGFPLMFYKEYNIDFNELVDKSNIADMIVIEQTNDPIGSFKDVKNALNGKLNVIEIPGDNHAYSDIKLIKPIIDKFLK